MSSHIEALKPLAMWGQQFCPTRGKWRGAMCQGEERRWLARYSPSPSLRPGDSLPFQSKPPFPPAAPFCLGPVDTPPGSKAALRWLARTAPSRLWNTWLRTSRSGEPVASSFSSIVQISGKSSKPSLGPPPPTASNSCSTADSTFTPKRTATHTQLGQIRDTARDFHTDTERRANFKLTGTPCRLNIFTIHRHSLPQLHAPILKAAHKNELASVLCSAASEQHRTPPHDLQESSTAGSPTQSASISHSGHKVYCGGSGQDDTSAKATLRRESNKGTARSEFTTPERESWSLTSNRVSSTDWSYRPEST
ncbi:hypothetical protein EYF80_027131 [Liparis tanakae]|uniref:Uncharacterized protein n=1 Tax=Liparis tanakae TaxID=230148 RepID=A0A4Z2HAY8_9TELE|nr:hypothetical protein EYF80_027131 [Liparis tanakae]